MCDFIKSDTLMVCLILHVALNVYIDFFLDFFYIPPMFSLICKQAPAVLLSANRTLIFHVNTFHVPNLMIMGKYQEICVELFKK